MVAMLEVISFFVVAVGFIEATGTCGSVHKNPVEMSDGWTAFTHKQPQLVKIEATYKDSKKEFSTVKCLGAAITEKWVLTVSVCVEKSVLYVYSTSPDYIVLICFSVVFKIGSKVFEVRPTEVLRNIDKGPGPNVALLQLDQSKGYDKKIEAYLSSRKPWRTQFRRPG